MSGVLRAGAVFALVTGGIMIGGTVLAVRGIDRLGDKLQDVLH